VLTVGDDDGCPGELLFRVVVAPPCSPDSLHIPNAFTPNGDGNNDVFRVVPYEGSEVISSLEIYDRWGVKVYENKGNSGWDGTINDKPGPSDVYVYIVTVNCGELIGKRVGDVTLLR
jgi:gliding motility-associated-like protein